MSIARHPNLDEEAALALTAMRRARARAVQIARATGTSIVESKDGKLVLVEPDSAELEPEYAAEKPA